MSFLFINKTLRFNNLKTRTAINAKIAVFFICVKAIIYLLLYNLHDGIDDFLRSCFTFKHYEHWLHFWISNGMKRIIKSSRIKKLPKFISGEMEGIKGDWSFIICLLGNSLFESYFWNEVQKNCKQQFLFKPVWQLQCSLIWLLIFVEVCYLC